MVALLNCARMILLVCARLVMFVVRQVPTFMLCAANTSFRLVLSAGSAVGSGVASSEVGAASSVDSELDASEEGSSEEISTWELPSAVLALFPLSHPVRDRMRSPVAKSKMLFFFKFHTLLSVRFFNAHCL